MIYASPLTYDSNISKGHQDQRMCMPLDLKYGILLSTLSQYKCHTSAHQPKCIQADLFTRTQYSPALRLNPRGSVQVILPANRNMILDSTSPLTPRPSLFRNLGRFSRHHINRTSSLESCLLHCFVGLCRDACKTDDDRLDIAVSTSSFHLLHHVIVLLFQLTNEVWILLTSVIEEVNG